MSLKYIVLDCLICVPEKKVTNADGDVGEEEPCC